MLGLYEVYSVVIGFRGFSVLVRVLCGFLWFMVLFSRFAGSQTKVAQMLRQAGRWPRRREGDLPPQQKPVNPYKPY